MCVGVNFYPTNRRFGYETNMSYSGVEVISGQHRKSQGRKNGLVKKSEQRKIVPCREKRLALSDVSDRIGDRYNGEGVILRKILSCNYNEKYPNILRVEQNARALTASARRSV